MKQFILLFLGSIITGSVFAKYTFVENLDGRTIQVERLELEQEQIEFEMRSGKKYTLPMRTRSEQSQQAIRTWHEKASKITMTQDDRIKIAVHTKRDSDGVDGG